MPYTTEDGGRLNNFALEPKVYQATPPSATQKRNYILYSVLALGLIGGLIYIAYSASSVG
ncbi:MAG: ssl1498 family light-harvesting-like protein [Symploca sp. SIO1B1]|nr:ssl1498 family light-harvesting-like protein [Symploca sp. SIO1C2]NER47061.1 ssl1498 family light-harvesting-like protein [Symploca sp. SIO1A3]NER97769.1 ssl1498 family light-harvesting-like protein [Symploca sp. SIO1B1]